MQTSCTKFLHIVQYDATKHVRFHGINNGLLWYGYEYPNGKKQQHVNAWFVVAVVVVIVGGGGINVFVVI